MPSSLKLKKKQSKLLIDALLANNLRLFHGYKQQIDAKINF